MTSLSFSSSTAATNPPPSFHSRLEKVNSPDIDAGGVIAPWWAAVTSERVATADGRPMPAAFYDSYDRLLTALDDLVDDSELCADVAFTAKAALLRCMFSGAVTPNMTWHGGDAVVLFWSGGGVSTFFTLGVDSVSVLQECEGVINKRVDDLPISVWDLMFPTQNGVH